MSFDPNPLYYKMVKYYSKYFKKYGRIILCNEGGSRCFHSEQLIITKKGSKKISDLKKGELVLSYNHEKETREYKKILSCLKSKNIKKCLKITFKNDSVIKCTEDHEIFYKNKYIKAKDLVSLLKNEKEKNNNTG